jgi:hypothetical protein
MTGSMAKAAGVGILIVAAIVTWMTGEDGVTKDKLAGILLALIAFCPVFFLLMRASRKADPKEVLIIFISGFFFKLLVLGGGVWWGLKSFGFQVNSFVVPCLAFLFALQIVESLYFGKRKE